MERIKKLISLIPLLLLFLTCSLSCEGEATSSFKEKIEIIKTKYADIKIGILSGTFDPPTQAHNAIIRSALEHLGLERLYIFVNKNGEKSYKCSSKERVEMLKRMLKESGYCCPIL